MNSRPVKRIEDVMRLRTAQYSEDSGPMAHPVRPDSYIKMDNFYTVTVYEKVCLRANGALTHVLNVHYELRMAEYASRADCRPWSASCGFNYMLTRRIAALSL